MKTECRNCQFEEIYNQIENNLEDYLRNIPDDKRTDEDVYKKRLDACNSCNKFINGLCRVCGCFVMIRAAVKDAYCPGIQRLW